MRDTDSEWLTTEEKLQPRSPQMVVLVREISLFQGNVGGWNIIPFGQINMKLTLSAADSQNLKWQLTIRRCTRKTQFFVFWKLRTGTSKSPNWKRGNHLNQTPPVFLKASSRWNPRCPLQAGEPNSRKSSDVSAASEDTTEVVVPGKAMWRTWHVPRWVGCRRWVWWQWVF